MTWRLAASLTLLRTQINDRWPHRSTISDGSIGDAAHASRDSDHNPWCGAPADPTVTAIDITHDPDDGPDMHQLSEVLRESRDPRIKYVIWNGRMFSSYASGSTPAWTWRPYSGPNAHAHHMHVSVQCNFAKDSVKAWPLESKEWDEMASKAEIKEAVREVVKDVVAEVVEEQLREMRVTLAVGNKQDGYDPDRVNLKAILNNLSGN